MVFGGEIKREGRQYKVGTCDFCRIEIGGFTQDKDRKDPKESACSCLAEECFNSSRKLYGSQVSGRQESSCNQRALSSCVMG